MGEYHDFYLKTDVMLLSDVFENYRDLDLKTYNVDPAWYLTAPSFSLDVALKKYGEKIELFNNTKEQENMYNFIEKGIRGGISNISHRHSIANNKYTKNYDPTKESKYIVYLDANNLYGWAMQQKLSDGNYKWENTSLFTEKYINNINENGQSGYILEVDLEYPQSLHEYHSSYPLCPERKLIET